MSINSVSDEQVIPLWMSFVQLTSFQYLVVCPWFVLFQLSLSGLLLCLTVTLTHSQDTHPSNMTYCTTYVLRDYPDPDSIALMHTPQHNPLKTTTTAPISPAIPQESDYSRRKVRRSERSCLMLMRTRAVSTGRDVPPSESCQWLATARSSLGNEVSCTGDIKVWPY